MYQKIFELLGYIKFKKAEDKKEEQNSNETLVDPACRTFPYINKAGEQEKRITNMKKEEIYPKRGENQRQ